jgi:hypothetical protein
VKLLVELAFQAVAVGGCADATLCACLLLPALKLLRGAMAVPAACRGATTRALLALAPPLSLLESEQTSPTTMPMPVPVPSGVVYSAAAATVAASVAADRTTFGVEVEPSSVASLAAAAHAARTWRDAASRRRRRAVLRAVGSDVSIDTSWTAEQHSGGREQGVEDSNNPAPTSPITALDCDDLSAVRGAASWALQLLLAPGSAHVRAEAASLIQYVAAIPDPVLNLPKP